MKEEINKTLNTIGQSTNIILEPAKQRMANPIIGSFVITFIALNWKPIVFLFLSSKTIEEKLEFFKNEFYGDKWCGVNDYWMYFIAPLLLTMIYVVLIPLAIEWIDKKLQFTKVNRLRRDNIINYKKHRGQESIAWAQFKTEEARTGFEDRNKLNKDLDKFKNDLTAEKENIKKLTDTNIKQTEEITDLNNQVKELIIERDSFKRESNNLNKTVFSNDKIINDLNASIIEKNTSIENLNLQVQLYSNEILQKNQSINELNIKNGEFENYIANLQSQSSHQNNEIERLVGISMTQNDEINQLNSDVLNWKNSYENLAPQFEALNLRLQQFYEIENNYPNFIHYLNHTEEKLGLPVRQDFHNISSVSDFVGKLLRFVEELNNLNVNDLRQKANFRIVGYLTNNVSDQQLINDIYQLAQNYGLTIVRINFFTPGQVEIFLVSEEHMLQIFSDQINYLINNISILPN